MQTEGIGYPEGAGMGLGTQRGQVWDWVPRGQDWLTIWLIRLATLGSSSEKVTAIYVQR